jgi:hypothetical protein
MEGATILNKSGKRLTSVEIRKACSLKYKRDSVVRPCSEMLKRRNKTQAQQVRESLRDPSHKKTWTANPANGKSLNDEILR